jgi:hypothetical protein
MYLWNTCVITGKFLPPSTLVVELLERIQCFDGILKADLQNGVSEKRSTALTTTVCTRLCISANLSVPGSYGDHDSIYFIF